MEGRREFTFITPSGVTRIWLKEDDDLENFCHYNGYSLAKEEEKEHSLIAEVNMIRTPNMKIECPLPYYSSPSSAKL